ncbi:MAG TPA: MFS transporter, partial [Acidimicrobiia bacterium]|nr:MFS transporter [Acidimicrobiia bacterium]
AFLIRAELGFGELALGAAASLYYISSALSNLPGGRLAERLGGRQAMAVAAACTVACGVGIAWLTHSWALLTGFLVIGGFANGVALPASNLAIARGISPRRQGVAFGVKQSSGAYATLIAGLSVPAIGLTVGWRWAYVALAAGAVPLLLRGAVRRSVSLHRRGSRADVAVTPLRFLSLAAWFAVISTSSLGAFYVESAVSGGTSPGLAGVLFAAGSVAAVAARIGWGQTVGRRTSAHFRLMAVFLSAGAVGFALLSVADSVAPLVVATLLVFAGGWGWPGLLSLAVVTRNPDAPGIASGIVGVGQFGGGIVGPLGFGFLVENVSYRAAWAAAAAAGLVAASLMLIGGRAYERAAGGDRLLPT